MISEIYMLTNLYQLRSNRDYIIMCIYTSGASPTPVQTSPSHAMDHSLQDESAAPEQTTPSAMLQNTSGHCRSISDFTWAVPPADHHVLSPLVRIPV